MCGISGMLSGQSMDRHDLIALVRRMGSYQVHRGPDSWGEFSDSTLAFGHNRLSIVDLEYGHQPMLSHDGRFVIIYNGEVYNSPALRNELIGLGFSFKTDHSDTETILVGYQCWGSDVFEKLEGMFAFAIWDTLERKLIIARDRFGIKPLYFSFVPGEYFVFSSEPKAILSTQLFKPSLNTAAVLEYFHFRSPVHPNTLIEQIRKVSPGKWLTVDMSLQKITVNEFAALENAKSEPEAASLKTSAMNEFDRLLEASVREQLIADVPVGVFLSGGVDSSLIATLATRYRNVEAHNIGTNSPLDESEFAKKVSDQLKIKLHTRYLKDDDFLSKIQDWVYHNDDPVSDPSALALMLLSEQVNQNGVKVMLSGEGSDEMFAGYYSYLKYRLVKRMKKFLPWSMLKSLLRFIGERKLIDYIEYPGLPFLGTSHLTTFEQKKSLFGEASETLIRQFRESYKQRFDEQVFKTGKGPLLIDQITRLPADLLARTDRATMAFSIEARVPFLNSRLHAFSASCPNSFFIGAFGLKCKALLKEVAASWVPSEVIYRRKRGFDLPVHQWLNHAFADTINKFLSEKKISVLNYQMLNNLTRNGVAVKDSALVWAWLILEYWYRAWFEHLSAPKISEQSLKEYFSKPSVSVHV